MGVGVGDVILFLCEPYKSAMLGFTFLLGAKKSVV